MANQDGVDLGGVYLGPQDKRIAAEWATFLAETRPSTPSARAAFDAYGPQILEETFYAGAFGALTMVMVDMHEKHGNSPAEVVARLIALYTEAREFMTRLFPDMADGRTPENP